MSSVTRTPAERPARSRNPRGQGAQLRADLLDASLDLLAATGDPEDVSIRAVAKAAGVSPGAVYQHFDDRDALLESACDRAFERFSAFLIAATEGIDDPFERLADLGRAYLRFAERDPGLYRVLFSNPLHLSGHHHHVQDGFPHDDSPGSTAFAVLVGMVEECLAAGAPAGPDADAVRLSFQIWAWLHGLVDLRITHPQMPWPDAESLVLEVGPALGVVPRPT